MIDPPNATYLEDEYHFVWDGLDVEVVVEGIHEERRKTYGDFSPQSIGGNGFLPTQTIDLKSAESAKRYANVLGSQLLDGDQWFHILTQAQSLSLQRYRSGAPSVALKDVEWRGKMRFAVYPLVEDEVRSMLFGDGGVSKSLHAIAIAVSIATGCSIIPGTRIYTTGPVLYLDWEDEPTTHAERLAAICAGAGIEVPDNIHYMRRTGSLHEGAREIRREIARLGAVFVVVDSVGAACGGDPEKASDVIRAFDAMRSLGVTVLALHHVTKEQKDRTKPFGSVYSPNLSRLTWRLDAERGKGEIYIRAQSFKSNNAGELPQLGHRVGFAMDEDGRLEEVTFTSAAQSRLPAGATIGNGLRNKIGAALRTGPMRASELAMELDIAENNVRNQLSRHKDWFIKLNDGRWALKAEEDVELSAPVVRTSEITGAKRTAPHPPPIRGGGARQLDEMEEGNVEELPW